MLTELGLYKLLDENPERTWPVARGLVIPVAKAIVPSWGYGHERVPVEGPAVVASNHFSEVDPAVVGLHSTRTLYYMAKIELLSIPIVGEILRWTGAFAVRRGEGDRDALRVARWAVQQGHVAGVFAEGTRQQFGYPGPMHPGAAMLAIQEGVPLVPCGIDTLRLEPEEPAQVRPRLGRADHARPSAQRQGLQGGRGDRRGRSRQLWRRAAQAVADGFPETLPDGLRRRGYLNPRDTSGTPSSPPGPTTTGRPARSAPSIPKRR